MSQFSRIYYNWNSNLKICTGRFLYLFHLQNGNGTFARSSRSIWWLLGSWWCSTSVQETFSEVLPKRERPKLDTVNWATLLPLSLCCYLLLLQIGPARFRAPELLFRPDLIGEECEGLHEVLVFAIQKSDMDLRRTLFSNIVLSGGSTLFKGSCFSFSGLCYTWSLFLFLLMWNREDNLDHPACPVGWGLWELFSLWGVPVRSRTLILTNFLSPSQNQGASDPC